MFFLRIRSYYLNLLLDMIERQLSPRKGGSACNLWLQFTWKELNLEARGFLLAFGKPLAVLIVSQETFVWLYKVPVTIFAYLIQSNCMSLPYFHLIRTCL